MSPLTSGESTISRKEIKADLDVEEGCKESKNKSKESKDN